MVYKRFILVTIRLDIFFLSVPLIPGSYNAESLGGHVGKDIMLQLWFINSEYGTKEVIFALINSTYLKFEHQLNVYFPQPKSHH